MNTAQLNLDESQRNAIAQNLKRLMELRKTNENRVAQELNIPTMTVRRLLSGETTDPRVYTLKTIADYFNVSIDALIESNSISPFELTTSSKPTFIPIFDWQTAKNREKINLKKWQEWIPLTIGNNDTFSKETFALESRPSMYPRFQQGTLFVLDPKLTPLDGDLVLVNLLKNDELTLKELFVDPPECQLHPISHGSSILEFSKEEYKIMAVVLLTLFYNRKLRS